MRLHRFYINPEEIELTHEFWFKDEALRRQWLKVLRYKENDQVVLFDGVSTERLYKLVRVESDAVKLELVTEFKRKVPSKHIYLFFSLLKKDKNDWVMQKCTELGVRNFVPIIAERSEKTGFNIDRARKITIEASEQCGRSDIPEVREPVRLETALAEYKDKIILLCADSSFSADHNSMNSDGRPVGVFIGPEGGWTESELVNFKDNNVGGLNLGELVLRAETASVVGSGKLLGF